MDDKRYEREVQALKDRQVVVIVVKINPDLLAEPPSTVNWITHPAVPTG